MKRPTRKHPRPRLVGKSDNAYVYQGALYCEDDGALIRWALDQKGKTPEDVDDERTYDSDDYPKGPYADGGGEADSPQFCDAGATCVNAFDPGGGEKIGQFLDNPLTTEGVKSVVAVIKRGVDCRYTDRPNCRHLMAMARFYIDEYGRSHDDIGDTYEAFKGGKRYAQDLWRESDKRSGAFPVDKDEAYDALYGEYDVPEYSNDEGAIQYAYEIAKREWRRIVEDPRQERLPGIQGRRARR